MTAERPPDRSGLTDATAFGLVAVAAACWAGNHIAGRWMAGGAAPVPPGGLTLLRWLLAFAVLIPFAWRQLRVDWPILRAHTGILFALGLGGGTLFSVIQYYALQLTTAVNVGVMNSVGPAFIILAGMLIFRDRASRNQLIGIAVSLVGVLVIITRGDPRVLAGLSFNAGDLLALINMAIFAIYSACLRLAPKVGVTTSVTVLCMIAVVGSVPFAVVETLGGYPVQATSATLVAVVYTGLFTSLLAYFSWMAGVGRLGPARAGALLHLVPLFGATLSVLLLGEEPRPFHAVGLLLIVAGVRRAAQREVA